jgi:hypothetical protein
MKEQLGRLLDYNCSTTDVPKDLSGVVAMNDGAYKTGPLKESFTKQAAYHIWSSL